MSENWIKMGEGREKNKREIEGKKEDRELDNKGES